VSERAIERETRLRERVSTGAGEQRTAGVLRTFRGVEALELHRVDSVGREYTLACPPVSPEGSHGGPTCVHRLCANKEEEEGRDNNEEEEKERDNKEEEAEGRDNREEEGGWGNKEEEEGREYRSGRVVRARICAVCLDMMSWSPGLNWSELF